MNPDQSFEKDAAGTHGPGARPVAVEGATDIFGTLPPAAAHEITQVPAPPVAPAPPPVSEPEMSRMPPPVVHAMVFKPDATHADGSDPLLQLLRSAPPGPKVPQPTPGVTPPAPPEAPAISSGGFTQLLRALNFDQPRPEAATHVQAGPVSAVAPTASSITQLLGTIDASQEPVAPEVAAAAPESPVEAALRVVEEGRPLRPSPTAGRPPAPVSSPSVSAQVTSFRQMTQTPPPVPLMVDAAVETRLPVAAASSVVKTPPPQSFTQLFENSGTGGKFAKAPDSAAAARTEVEPMAQGAIEDGAESASPPSIDRGHGQRAEAPRVPPPGAGSFTQMFNVPEAPPDDAAASSAVVLPASPPGSLPGSFTQMFQALNAEPARAAKAAPAPLAAHGTFTQMSSAPPPVQAAQRGTEGPPAASTPGSFTQIFQALGAESSQAAAAVPPQHPPSVPASFTQPEPSAPGGFTQMFNTLSSPAAEAGHSEPQSSRSPAPPTSTPYRYDYPPAAPPPAAAPVGVGLTQLLRALDQPLQQGSAPAFQHASTPPAGPGTFTGTYGSLDGSGSAAGPQAAPQAYSPPAPAFGGTGAFGAPPASAPPLAPPVTAGPSEFTRILNASSLRESGLRGGGEAMVPPASSTAPHAAASPQWAMPAIPPAPHVPHVPQVKLPPVPKPTLPAVPTVAAAGKMHQLLPLLLILIIFLLVALLVAVVFLMKR